MRRGLRGKTDIMGFTGKMGLLAWPAHLGRRAGQDSPASQVPMGPWAPRALQGSQGIRARQARRVSWARQAWTAKRGLTGKGVLLGLRGFLAKTAATGCRATLARPVLRAKRGCRAEMGFPDLVVWTARLVALVHPDLPAPRASQVTDCLHEPNPLAPCSS